MKLHLDWLLHPHAQLAWPILCQFHHTDFQWIRLVEWEHHHHQDPVNLNFCSQSNSCTKFKAHERMMWMKWCFLYMSVWCEMRRKTIIWNWIRRNNNQHRKMAGIKIVSSTEKPKKWSFVEKKYCIPKWNDESQTLWNEFDFQNFKHFNYRT